MPLFILMKTRNLTKVSYKKTSVCMHVCPFDKYYQLSVCLDSFYIHPQNTCFLFISNLGFSSEQKSCFSYENLVLELLISSLIFNYVCTCLRFFFIFVLNRRRNGKKVAYRDQNSILLLIKQLLRLLINKSCSVFT